MAGKAASILEEHGDKLLARWQGRIETVIPRKGLEGLLSDSALARDAAGVFDRLLVQLRGEEAEAEFSELYHWIHDGQQYDVSLADLTQVLLDLKSVAKQIIREQERDSLAALRLGDAVDGAVDQMVKRCADLYQLSNELELRTIQERVQQVFSAWQAEGRVVGGESPEEIFRMVCDKRGEAFQLGGCVVRLYGETGEKERELSTAQGLPMPLMKAKAQYLTEEERAAGDTTDIMEMCRRTREAIIRQVGRPSPVAEKQAGVSGVPVRDDVLNASELVEVGVRSVACVPMFIGEKLNGVLLLLASGPSTFQAEGVRMLMHFAEVLGPALTHTGDMERARRQVTEAEVIARIGRLLLELPSLEELLQAVVDAMRQFRDYSHVALFRLDEETGECVLTAQADAEEGEWPGGQCVKLGEGLVGMCAQGGEPMLAGDAGDGRLVAVTPQKDGSVRSELAMPIKKGHRVTGVMHFVSAASDAFGEGEQRVLENLSTHIALALQNVELLEKQRRDRYEIENAHRQLSTIIRSTAVGITSMDTKGVFTHWSPSCEKMLGYREGEVVGKMRMSDIAAEPYDVKAVLRECLQEGPTTRERVLVRKDGRHRIIQEMNVPMMDEEGDHIGFTSCLVDISEKRQSEAALVQERDKLNLVVDAMGAGLALFDVQRRLQWANSTLMEWFNLGPHSSGQECGAIYACSDQHSDSCPLMTTAEIGGTQSGVVERTDQSGAWHCYLLVATPVQYGEARLLTLTMDITEQRRQTEQVQLISKLTQALERTLDLDRLLHLVLTCVTAGHALGFNRAFVFLMDESKQKLAGELAVGPASPEEASRIWSELSQESRTLAELLAAPGPAEGDRVLTQAVQLLEVPATDAGNILVQTLETRAPIIVKDAWVDERVSDDLVRVLGLEEFVCVPLVARDEPLGVMLADHKFSRIPIDEHQAELIRMFSAQVSLAIANARAYRKISDQMEEIKRAQHELIEAERLASVGRMAGHMAHEIRNPLTMIGGFARAIKRSPTSDKLVRKNASVIYDEVIRLEQTLAGVLDFTRPIRPQKRLVSINGLIKDTVKKFRSVLQANGIEVRLDLQKDLPRARVDSGLIKQVIINLLKNAVEALEGRDIRHIVAGTSASGKGILISLSDSGSGMDEETLKTPFAPFFTTKVGGSGLGLLISQKIVAEHGGEISVESELGKGSTFYVFLPWNGRKANQ